MDYGLFRMSYFYTNAPFLNYTYFLFVLETYKIFVIFKQANCFFTNLQIYNFCIYTNITHFLLVGGKTTLVMMPARTAEVVIYFKSTYS